MQYPILVDFQVEFFFILLDSTTDNLFLLELPFIGVRLDMYGIHEQDRSGHERSLRHLVNVSFLLNPSSGRYLILDGPIDHENMKY